MMHIFSGRGNTFAKIIQNTFCILPVIFSNSHKPAVPAVTVCVELFKIWNLPGAKWVEVNVSYQFQQIGFFLTEDGLRATLKQ